MKPGQLFVFAGAGVSRSMPANLPVFWRIRDAILCDLGLTEYVSGDPNGRAEAVRAAEGLLPEPFMLSLRQAGVDVEAWLGEVLDRGRPNAAHAALAQLAQAGARVWTVNFDRLIEQAAGGLDVVAWPEAPRADAELTKPHGTLGGPLIVTAQQVLGELSAEWRDQLSRDVAGRTVIFIGYSGNDLDFRPVWDDVLQGADEVLWFDMPDPTAQARRRHLLRKTHDSGRLHFPANRPTPSATGANPSYDFVQYCRDQRVVELEGDFVGELCQLPTPIDWPPLPHAGRAVEGSVRGLLGDFEGARGALVSGILRGPERIDALKDLVTFSINHGGRGVAGALAVRGALIPPVGPGRAVHASAHRKRVTILANLGRHDAVMRATRRPPADGASTELILRSAAERYVVSLDAAAETAERAIGLALEERHNVRTAHAAYQLAMGLLWAGRFEDAIECLDQQLEPYASLAANRWVAWADFVAACLLVRTGGTDEGRRARQRLELASTRFRAEALVDGTISADTADLAARRRTGEIDGLVADASALRNRIRVGEHAGRYYTRGHGFALEAVDLELAEALRVHLGDPPRALDLFGAVSRSRYPLHRSLALLGLALVADRREDRITWANMAASVGRQFGARDVAGHAQLVLDGAPDADRELFFC